MGLKVKPWPRGRRRRNDWFQAPSKVVLNRDERRNEYEEIDLFRYVASAAGDAQTDMTRRNRRVELRSESIENGHERPCDSVLHVVWHGENDSEV